MRGVPGDRHPYRDRGDHNGTPPLEGDCGEDSAEPVAKTHTKSSATARRTKEPETNYIGALSPLDPHWSLAFIGSAEVKEGGEAEKYCCRGTFDKEIRRKPGGADTTPMGFEYVFGTFC